MSDRDDIRRAIHKLEEAGPDRAGEQRATRAAGDELQVRRARRADVPGIATLVGHASPGKRAMDEAEVMDWLFDTGLLVAVAGGQIVGAATWQAENLLSVTDRFYMYPSRLRNKAGRGLLNTIEAEANVLMCEANVVLVPQGTAQPVCALLQKQGYERKAFQDLHRIWREVLGEYMAAEPELVVKRLRDKMVMVPI